MRGHIGITSEAPLDLFKCVLESRNSLKETQDIQNQPRPLLFQRREAEGLRVSEFSADTTP